MHTTPLRLPSYRKAFTYSVFLGWTGADRFYIGDSGIGALKLLLMLALVPWIADNFIIRSHKNDWESWITSKRNARITKKQEIEDAKQRLLEKQALRKERAGNGQCPECGSANLTAVSETTNELSFGAALTQLGNPSKFIPRDKIVAKTRRVCLNCGHKF